MPTDIDSLDEQLVVSGNYTADAADEVIIWDDTQGGGSIQLLAVSLVKQEQITITNLTNFPLRVIANASDKIQKTYDEVKFKSGTIIFDGYTTQQGTSGESDLFNEIQARLGYDYAGTADIFL